MPPEACSTFPAAAVTVTGKLGLTLDEVELELRFIVIVKVDMY